MTEVASLYGPVADDIPEVGQRLRGLAQHQTDLLGDTLAYIFETGGKKIRPALVLLSGSLGEYDLTRLVTLSASLEVVHMATLVHDDTVDEALTRRGLATISSVWSPNVAILVGDFLFAQSAFLAAELQSVRIMSLLSETVMAMIGGELRQFEAAQSRSIDEQNYLERIAGKTASLFAMCCEGAGIVSGQSEERLTALREYGFNLGMAFQIVDDVLDFVGVEDSLGKPAGSDLRNGTITLPAILFAQQRGVDSVLVHDLHEGRNVEQLIGAIQDSGSAEDALERGRAYADRACSALTLFPASPSKDALLSLGDYVLSRKN